MQMNLCAVHLEVECLCAKPLNILVFQSQDLKVWPFLCGNRLRYERTMYRIKDTKLVPENIFF